MKYIKNLLLMIVMLFVINIVNGQSVIVNNGCTFSNFTFIVTSTSNSATLLTSVIAFNSNAVFVGHGFPNLHALMTVGGATYTNQGGVWHIAYSGKILGSAILPYGKPNTLIITNVYRGLSQNATYKLNILPTIDFGGIIINTNLYFTTSPVYVTPATISSIGITNIVTTSAVFLGTVNPNGNSGLAHFEYTLGSSFGMNSILVTPDLAFDNSSTNSSLTNLVTGLSLGQTYAYRFVVSNSVSVISSPAQTFIAGTTRGNNPNTPATLNSLVDAEAYTNVTFTLQINPNNHTGHVFFAWNTIPIFNTWNDAGVINGGVGATNVTYLVTTLTPYTSYYYTAAFVSDITTYTITTNLFLYTATAPVYTLAALMVHGSNGVVDANTRFTDAYCDAPSTSTSLVNRAYIDNRVSGFSATTNLVVLPGHTDLLFVINGVTNKVALTTYP